MVVLAVVVLVVVPAVPRGADGHTHRPAYAEAGEMPGCVSTTAVQFGKAKPLL